MTGVYLVKLSMLQNDFSAISIESSDLHSWTADLYPAQAERLQLINKVSF